MANIAHLFILVLVTTAAVLAYHGADLPPGPYCGSRSVNQCCSNRKDDCSHRILGTLCYCDQFCNRTLGMDDCCPDYEYVCLGYSVVTTTTPPPGPLIVPCRHNGKIYFPRDKRIENCNVCECVADPYNESKTKWVCGKETCLMSEDVVYGVNRKPHSWRAANYSELYGKTLKDGLVYKLGTLPLGPETRRMTPIRYDIQMDFPEQFDARRRWPGFISPVIDQGWCGSDWAVAIATVASDRYAIQSNGAERSVLSPQLLLSCSIRGQRGCDGGYIDIAWNFANGHGLIEDDCYPYMGKKTKCVFNPRGTLQEDGCTPMDPKRTSRYKVGPPSRLKEQDDIMYDIMESGPVHAVMTVYQDFFHYRDGVYRHTPYGDNALQGLHSVRIIGWGEERGDKYWLVANSWGTQWGENGYFRIARGVNESGIEDLLITVLPDVTEAYSKRK